MWQLGQFSKIQPQMMIVKDYECKNISGTKPEGLVAKYWKVPNEKVYTLEANYTVIYNSKL